MKVIKGDGDKPTEQEQFNAVANNMTVAQLLNSAVNQYVQDKQLDKIGVLPIVHIDAVNPETSTKHKLEVMLTIEPDPKTFVEPTGNVILQDKVSQELKDKLWELSKRAKEMNPTDFYNELLGYIE